MKIRFIDSYSGSLDYNVGDIFKGNISCCDDSDSDVSELRFDIDTEPAIYAYNKSTDRREMGWSLHCQDVFLIVDQETNRILFTSKKYDRCHRGDEFIEELREAIASGFNIAEPSKFELSSEVEFMDI
jgi:hypothetical protein